MSGARFDLVQVAGGLFVLGLVFGVLGKRAAMVVAVLCQPVGFVVYSGRLLAGFGVGGMVFAWAVVEAARVVM